jgi:O-antigen biosynthesis protein
MDSHQLFVESKLKKVAEFIKPDSSVLDIGCEDAKILNFIKADYWAVDVDKENIKKLKEKGIKTIQLDLNKDKISIKRKFDYILLLDILEHLIDPKKTLTEMRSLLNPEGKIIISLPNDYNFLNKIRFLFNKNLTEFPFYPYGHLHIFPINEGEKMIRDSGLKILQRIDLPAFKPIFVPHSIQRILSKISPQNFTRDVLYITSVAQT